MVLLRTLRLAPLMLVTLLAGCSDERASLYIDSRDHALTVIRVQRFFWDKTAEFTIVPTRMPDCMRRHKLGNAPKDTPIEIFAPGNNAWIVRFGKQLFVTETRSCEGFAPLETEPEGGLGTPVGHFTQRKGKFFAVPAKAADASEPDGK